MALLIRICHTLESCVKHFLFRIMLRGFPVNSSATVRSMRILGVQNFGPRITAVVVADDQHKM